MIQKAMYYAKKGENKNVDRKTKKKCKYSAYLKKGLLKNDNSRESRVVGTTLRRMGGVLTWIRIQIGAKRRIPDRRGHRS